MEQDLLPESEDTFLSLVGGPAAVTIDDGEAATIAWAITNDAVIATDDRKAVQIAKVRFPLLKVLSTTDLLLHGNCQNALGPSAVVDCIENALLNAFMRVPIEQLDRVVQLLGPERTKKCRSLPSAVRG